VRFGREAIEERATGLCHNSRLGGGLNVFPLHLPKRVQAYLEDLETLLARYQVERGKDILASLGMEVVISADGTAEIRGDLKESVDPREQQEGK